MDLGQVGQLVDELRWVDVQVLATALLADQSFGALRVAAHELARLLVDLALGVYQRSRHLLYTQYTTSHAGPQSRCAEGTALRGRMEIAQNGPEFLEDCGGTGSDCQGCSCVVECLVILALFLV